MILEECQEFVDRISASMELSVHIMCVVVCTKMCVGVCVCGVYGRIVRFLMDNRKH